MIYCICKYAKRLDYVSLPGDSLPHRAVNIVIDNNSWENMSLAPSTEADPVTFYLPTDDDLSDHWTKQQYMPDIYKSPKRKKPKMILMI